VLRTVPGFDFWRTVLSHGWYALSPFSYDAVLRQLSRVLELGDGTVVHTLLRGMPDKSVGVTATSSSTLNADRRREVERQLRTCLRLDEDFSDFYAETRRHPHYRWISRSGAGRMLRSPTVFEDAVKMICTTNCTWALTTLMAENLVRRFGTVGDTGYRTFPHPEAIARSTEAVLRTQCKTGYRSPFLLDLARRVADGTLDVESWRTTDAPTEELYRHMHTAKGIGPYAAGNLLKLVGRYEYLGLDSWVRARYYKLHTGGRRVKDSTIEKRYTPYGRWRGLLFWLEMTQYWHDDKFTV